jgi:hypothetical protein
MPPGNGFNQNGANTFTTPNGTIVPNNGNMPPPGNPNGAVNIVPPVQNNLPPVRNNLPPPQIPPSPMLNNNNMPPAQNPPVQNNPPPGQ